MKTKYESKKTNEQNGEKYYIKIKKWIMAEGRERIYMNNNKHEVSKESLHD